jgi:hypothetical protein
VSVPFRLAIVSKDGNMIFSDETKPKAYISQCSTVFMNIPPITNGEWLIILGLVFNIIGVYLVSISGILSEKPARTLYFLWRYVDRESPEETTADPPVDRVSPVGGGLASAIPPTDQDDYDWQIRTVAKQTAGVWTILFGFILQLIGTIL